MYLNFDNHWPSGIGPRTSFIACVRLNKISMKKISYTFSTSSTQFYFDAEFSFLEKLVNKDNAVIITDENIFNAHKKKFKGWSAIVLNPGEEYKIQTTVDEVIEQLIAFEADRKTFL